ncbi:hypothetical protein BGZ96_002847 [Linnemannia gamsii]|uniref:Guanine nucleotide-binding protein subunit gamma n=1 Tax=Linnemannia gamsii TaxID=64522 RepID=A0ABQ7JK05_9FUNG|nr:hypothetical protein BGZ96_002847 [Linnemannia gamsii]
MNSGPSFDIESHNYDNLLKNSNSAESITNSATSSVTQGGGVHSPAAAGTAAAGAQQPAPSPPSTAAAMTAQQHQLQQQEHYHQQQPQQPMNDSTMAMPAATSPPSMAALPRGPTFMGTSGVSEVKLKRFLEHNQRLREHLEMRRIPVSEASNSLIQFVTTTRDALIPSLWGTTGSDPFAKQSSGCCIIS